MGVGPLSCGGPTTSRALETKQCLEHVYFNRMKRTIVARRRFSVGTGSTAVVISVAITQPVQRSPEEWISEVLTYEANTIREQRNVYGADSLQVLTFAIELASIEIRHLTALHGSKLTTL